MLANGIKETTTTSGTGTVTLSAVTGRVRFSDVYGTGIPVYYAINDGNNWEWGIGLTAASNTLSRDTIVATYVSGTYDNTSPSAITLSGGTAYVYCTTHSATLSLPYRRADLTGISGGQNPYCFPANFMDNATDYSSVAISANVLYVAPFLMMDARSVTELGILVATAGAAGKVAAVGLFANNPTTGGPGKTLASVSGLAVDATGRVVTSCTEVMMPAGWYWCGVVSDGTPSLRGSNYFVPGPLGSGSGTTRNGRYISRSNTYAAFGSDVWTNASGSISNVNNVAMPVVVYR